MSFDLEIAPILLALTQVLLGVITLIVARLIKNVLSPYRMDEELTANDNPAFGLAVAGYYVAVVCVYLGAVRSHPRRSMSGQLGR